MKKIIFEAVAEITEKDFKKINKTREIAWDTNTPIATICNKPIKIVSARLGWH
jgi:hypothetical protein